MNGNGRFVRAPLNMEKTEEEEADESSYQNTLMN